MSGSQSQQRIVIFGKQDYSFEANEISSDQELSKQEKKQSTIGIEYPKMESYVIKDDIPLVKDRIKQHQTAGTRQVKSQRSRIVQTFALYKIVQEVNPRILQQSIEYLHCLYHSSRTENTFQKRFTHQSMRKCFSSFYGKGFEKLFSKSLQLLKNRITQIINQFQSNPNKDKSNIRVEILAHYIKIIVKFQEYIPNKQKLDHLRPDYLISLLKIKRENYKLLKQQYFEAKRDLVEFYDEERFNLTVLINTYYFLQVRQKCQTISSKFKDTAFFISKNGQNILKDEITQLKTNRQSYFSQERKQKIAKTFTTFSEEYTRISKKKQQFIIELSLQEIEQEVVVFEELFIEDVQTIKYHEKIVDLVKKYKRRYDYYETKFKDYKLKMNQYKKSFDSLKKVFIAKKIRQHVNFTYEDICKSCYQRNLIYISHRFFEEHIDEILRIQCRYQLILYLSNIIQLIQSSVGKKQVMFMQRCQQTEQDETSVAEKRVLMIAIDVQGINYSKEIAQQEDFEIKCKIFADQIMNKMSKSLIIINTSPDFELEQYFDSKRCKNKIQIHILSYPELFFFPNPCDIIFQTVRQYVKLSEKNEKKAPSTQFIVEKIARLIGKDIVDLELIKSVIFLDQNSKDDKIDKLNNRKSFFFKTESHLQTKLKAFDTSGLREYLLTLKLYNRKIMSIKLKG